MSSGAALRLAPIIFVAGMLVHVTLVELERARGRRGGALMNGWTAAWCAAGLVFAIARGVQLAGSSASVALEASRVLYTATLAIAALSFVGVHRLTGTPLARRTEATVGAVALGLATLTLTTDAVVVGAATKHVDWLGLPYASGRPAAGAILVGAAFAAAAVHCARWLLRSTDVVPERRRTMLVVGGFFVVTGVNDILMPLDLFPSVHLAHYGVLAMALALSHLQQDRVESVLDDLDRAVAERTADLHAEGERLVRTVAELRATESRYRLLAHATLEGVALHADGAVVDTNDTLDRLRGGPTPKGTRLTALFAEECRSTVSALMAEARPEPRPQELSALRLDGSTFPVEVVAGAAADLPAPGVLIVRDLTERRRMQAHLMLADRLASLGTLAAGAAHEINNPLAYVAANVHLAIEELTRPGAGPAAAALAASLRDAAEGCARIRGIVDDLRSLARSDRDDSLRPVDVATAVRSALRMAQPQIRPRARVEVAMDEVPTVLANEGRLVQVLVNLLVNAAQAIEEGDAGAHTIRVTVVRDDAAGQVEISVRDDGTGIPADVLPRIFDPFFTTKPQGAGMGLGLSICHSIVRALGGDMTAESRPGEGTTVRVKLPQSNALAVAEPASRPAPTPPRRARVLVVDDEPALVRALGRVLAGHEVVTARSGREALTLCAAGWFDVILCDLMMPDLTGMDVYERLVDIAPEQASRMVFVTGGAFTKRAQDFLAKVPNSRIDKPIDVLALRSLVDEVGGRVARAGAHGSA